jgi:hypothetical protein
MCLRMQPDNLENFEVHLCQQKVTAKSIRLMTSEAHRSPSVTERLPNTQRKSVAAQHQWMPSSRRGGGVCKRDQRYRVKSTSITDIARLVLSVPVSLWSPRNGTQRVLPACPAATRVGTLRPRSTSRARLNGTREGMRNTHRTSRISDYCPGELRFLGAANVFIIYFINSLRLLRVFAYPCVFLLLSTTPTGVVLPDRVLFSAFRGSYLDYILL